MGSSAACKVVNGGKRILHFLLTAQCILQPSLHPDHLVSSIPTDQMYMCRMLAPHMLVHVVPPALKSLCAPFDEAREFLNRHLMHVLYMSLQIRPVAELLFALVVRAAVQSVVAFRVLAAIRVSEMSSEDGGTFDLLLLSKVSKLLLAARTREYRAAAL